MVNDKRVKVLVLCGFGINCDLETAGAFERAGAEAVRVHLNDLIAGPARLDACQILAIPGGFSFGDDVASGKILANRLRYTLGPAIQKFVEAGKLAIGICNGFQVMVKMGFIPLFEGAFTQEVTLTHNDSGRFEDRWVTLAPDAASCCVWTKGLRALELPIRHGEGKFVARDDSTLDRMMDAGQVALRYVRPDASPARGEFPWNPNGSSDDIAGICDPSGRIFGLMPHPEAYIERTHHPRWTREALPEEGAGLQVFRNAVRFAGEHL